MIGENFTMEKLDWPKDACGLVRVGDTNSWKPTSNNNDRVLPADRFVFGTSFDDAIDRLQSRFPKPPTSNLETLIVRPYEGRVIVAPLPVAVNCLEVGDIVNDIRLYGPVLVYMYKVKALQRRFRLECLPLVVAAHEVDLHAGYMLPKVSYDADLALKMRVRYERRKQREHARKEAERKKRDNEQRQNQVVYAERVKRWTDVSVPCCVIINDMRKAQFQRLLKRARLNEKQLGMLGITAYAAEYNTGLVHRWTRPVFDLCTLCTVPGVVKAAKRHKRWAELWNAYTRLAPEDISSSDWDRRIESSSILATFVAECVAECAKSARKPGKKSAPKRRTESDVQ